MAVGQSGRSLGLQEYLSSVASSLSASRGSRITNIGRLGGDEKAADASQPSIHAEFGENLRAARP